MYQLTLYNAPGSYGRSIYGRPDRDCGRPACRSLGAGRSPGRSGLAHSGAFERFQLCSHPAPLRLILRTRPRSGPLRFGAAPAVKFLTVRNLITPSPRWSYVDVSANSLQCARPERIGRNRVAVGGVSLDDGPG